MIACAQVEGYATADGRGPSIWDTFSARSGTTFNGETGARCVLRCWHSSGCWATLQAPTPIFMFLCPAPFLAICRCAHMRLKIFCFIRTGPRCRRDGG